MVGPNKFTAAQYERWDNEALRRDIEHIRKGVLFDIYRLEKMMEGIAEIAAVRISTAEKAQTASVDRHTTRGKV